MRAFFAAILGALVISPTLAAADEPVAAPSPDSFVASQWIQPDENGSIYIKVFAPGDPSLVRSGRVALFDLTGQVLPAELNSEGLFVVRYARPGVYRLSYYAPGSYSACALTILAPGEGGRELPSTTSITASSLRPERTLNTIARYQPPRFDAVPQEGELPLPDASPVVPDGYQVVQNAEGGMDGRLFRPGWVAGGMVPAANVNVLIIRNDEVVGQAVTTVDGAFTVANLAPGVYDFIASGAAGFAALGFELIAPPEPPVDQPLAAAAKNPFRAASAVMQANGGLFELQLAPPTPNLVGEESFGAAGGDGGLTDGGFAPPMGAGFAPGGFAGGGFAPGGGFGGGAGGGGGGLGGGGGFGAFAAIGGAIAAAAIAASDDDDDLAVPVASP